MWSEPVGPTAIKFLDSDKLGKRYKNDLFVSDINLGNIYHFDLGENRDGLAVTGPLSDKISNNSAENNDIMFGDEFGGVTDLKVGPDDGYLYVLSLRHGAIYRIVS